MSTGEYSLADWASSIIELMSNNQLQQLQQSQQNQQQFSMIDQSNSDTVNHLAHSDQDQTRQNRENTFNSTRSNTSATNPDSTQLASMLININSNNNDCNNPINSQRLPSFDQTSNTNPWTLAATEMFLLLEKLSSQQNNLAQQYLPTNSNLNFNHMNNISVPNGIGPIPTSTNPINTSNNNNDNNPFARVISNPFLDCASSSVSNLSPPVPTSPIVYNTNMPTTNTNTNKTTKRHCSIPNNSNNQQRADIYPRNNQFLPEGCQSSSANSIQSILDFNLASKFIASNNLNFNSINHINNLHQSQHLLNHLQANPMFSNTGKNTTNKNQCVNSSLGSNVLNNNNNSITTSNNNIIINGTETCNTQAIAHQPSVPASSFLAKLTAVTTRSSGHSKTMRLDDKVVDLLEAFYAISDQPEPAGIEMIAKRIGISSDILSNWFNDKRLKLNGLSCSSRDNTGNVDVVDGTSDSHSPDDKQNSNRNSNLLIGNNNTCSVNRKRAGGRVVTFSEYQRSILEKIFDENNYLHPQEYEELSSLIEVPARNIKIWFKNRRSKQRLSGRTSVTVLNSAGARDMACPTLVARPQGRRSPS